MNKAHKVVGMVILAGAVSVGLFDRHEAIGLQAILESQALQDQIQTCVGTSASAEIRQDCIYPEYAAAQALMY